MCHSLEYPQKHTVGNRQVSVFRRILTEKCIIPLSCDRGIGIY